MTVQDGLAVRNFVGEPDEQVTLDHPYNSRDASFSTDDLRQAGLLVTQFTFRNSAHCQLRCHTIEIIATLDFLLGGHEAFLYALHYK